MLYALNKWLRTSNGWFPICSCFVFLHISFSIAARRTQKFVHSASAARLIRLHVRKFLVQTTLMRTPSLRRAIKVIAYESVSSECVDPTGSFYLSFLSSEDRLRFDDLHEWNVYCCFNSIWCGFELSACQRWSLMKLEWRRRKNTIRLRQSVRLTHFSCGPHKTLWTVFIWSNHNGIIEFSRRFRYGMSWVRESGLLRHRNYPN